MKFSVNRQIFEKWPQVLIGGLVLRNINNRWKSKDLTNLLQDQELKTKEELAAVELGQLPEISAWRKIHKDFGSDPRDFPPSTEALLRRARGGKGLPNINKLVDLYNYLSLKSKVPAGAEDIDKIEGDVRLTFADGTEKGKYIGSSETENCFKGEVVYKDDKGFICRRWNWREADRTKIDESTRNALLVFELALADLNKMNKFLDEAEELCSKYLGGEQTKFVLSKESFGVEY